MIERMYLTTEELADELQLSKCTIYQMVKRGSIPVVRISCKKFRFDVAAVREALQNLGNDYLEDN